MSSKEMLEKLKMSTRAGIDERHMFPSPAMIQDDFYAAIEKKFKDADSLSLIAEVIALKLRGLGQSELSETLLLQVDKYNNKKVR